jgi:hypothetical protein
MVRPVCCPPGVDGARGQGGGWAGDARGSGRQALLCPVQGLWRDLVGATGLGEVPALRHRALPPGGPSEWGWDELRAQKYRAWEHPLAWTGLAAWFIAQTQCEWARGYGRDPAWLQALETDGLPALSVAPGRTRLRAVMPWRQLSEAQATDLVIEPLLNRARSRKSRLKKPRLVKRTVAGVT